MSKSTRRTLLRSAAAAALAGQLPVEAAQHVHQHAAEAKKPPGQYKPAALTAHEMATLRRLADIILPADEVSKGASEAGAAEFIDLLCSGNTRLKHIYTGGLGWMDHQCRARFGGSFVEAPADGQTALLEEMNRSGHEFFVWVRRMVVDAFYTSPIGIADIGFQGNKGMTKFEVPAEAIAWALKRSNL